MYLGLLSAQYTTLQNCGFAVDFRIYFLSTIFTAITYSLFGPCSLVTSAEHAVRSKLADAKGLMNFVIRGAWTLVTLAKRAPHGENTLAFR